MAKGVKGTDVQRVLEEADQPAAGAGAIKAAAPAAVADIPDFCGIYRNQVRPVLLLIIKFLKIIKPDWAEILAKVVAYLDAICV